ncbi:MAG: lysine 2,3-aminomutase, partial [Deltaproteobacteria bacterium]
MQYIKYASYTNNELARKFILPDKFNSVASIYPFRISANFASLISKPGDPIWLQCIPDARELEGTDQAPDPL